jgi:hypothetical protein
MQKSYKQMKKRSKGSKLPLQFEITLFYGTKITDWAELQQ